MKKTLLSILLWIIISFPFFTNWDHLDTSVATKNAVKTFVRTWNSTSYQKLPQQLKTHNCNTWILRLMEFISSVDNFLEKKWKDKNYHKQKIYNILKKINTIDSKLLPRVFGQNGANFLLGYYDDIQDEDYFAWCFWENIGNVQIEWWHLILEWYLEKENYIYNPCGGPWGTEDECDPKNNIPTEQYYFVLIKNITNKQFIKRFGQTNNPSRLPIWCGIDWSISTLIYNNLTLSKVWFSKLYTLDKATLEALKKSSKNSPIKIYAWMKILEQSDEWNTGPICFGYFSDIELIK